MNSGYIHITFNSKETHRITDPVIVYKPRTLYYFTAFIKSTGQGDENLKFFHDNVAFIKEKLEKLEIIHQELDYTDYIEVIQELSKIIKKERAKESSCNIYINIGTGSKITAIASTEASRLWDCKLLYSYSTKYDPFDNGATHKGELVLKTPQVFPIQKPEIIFIKVLKIIQNALNQKYKDKETEIIRHFLYKKKLLELLKEEGFIKLKKANKNPRFTQASYYMKLNQRFLKPLATKLYYIEISKDKRNKKIFLTKKGKIVLEIFKYFL